MTKNNVKRKFQKICILGFFTVILKLPGACLEHFDAQLRKANCLSKGCEALSSIFLCFGCSLSLNFRNDDSL